MFCYLTQPLYCMQQWKAANEMDNPVWVTCDWLVSAVWLKLTDGIRMQKKWRHIDIKFNFMCTTTILVLSMVFSCLQT